MNETHNNHINGALVVLAALVVGGLLWFIISSSGDTYTSTPVDTKTTQTAHADEQLYYNDEYNFSLRYDDEFVQKPVLETDAWQSNSITAGKRLVTLYLPRELQPNTNFSEAWVSVGASADADAIKTCLVAQDGEVIQEGTDPRGFSVFTQTGAGAGNFYATISYRTVRNGACIALERVVHSVNIGNFDESQNITEFNRAIIESLLNRVVASFRFK